MIAQSFVSQLANTVNSTMKTALPAMLSVTGASGFSAAGLNVFGSAAEDGVSAHQGPNIDARIRPKDSDDPAYTHIHTTVVYVTALNSMLTSGEGGGVDWESVTAREVDPEKGNMIHILSMLDVDQRTFPPSESAPSKRYLEIVETSIRVS